MADENPTANTSTEKLLRIRFTGDPEIIKELGALSYNANYVPAKKTGIQAKSPNEPTAPDPDEITLNITKDLINKGRIVFGDLKLPNGFKLAGDPQGLIVDTSSIATAPLSPQPVKKDEQSEEREHAKHKARRELPHPVENENFEKVEGKPKEAQSKEDRVERLATLVNSSSPADNAEVQAPTQPENPPAAAFIASEFAQREQASEQLPPEDFERTIPPVETLPEFNGEKSSKSKPSQSSSVPKVPSRALSPVGRRGPEKEAGKALNAVKKAKKAQRAFALDSFIPAIAILFIFVFTFLLVLGGGGGGIPGANAGQPSPAPSPSSSPGGSTICGQTSTPPTNSPGFSCTGLTATQPMSDGYYIPTSFGCNTGLAKDPNDNCMPACANIPECNGLSGANCEDAVGWYSANSDQYGCNAKLLVTNPTTGKAVVVRAIDRGPSCSVQSGREKFDMSQAARAAIGGNIVQVQKVDDSTPLGPVSLCSAPSTPAPPGQNSIITWANLINNYIVRFGSACNTSTGPIYMYNTMLQTVTNGGYTAVKKPGSACGIVESTYYCSNLIIDSYNLAGIKNSFSEWVPTMIEQWPSVSGLSVRKSNNVQGLQPGDAIFWLTNSSDSSTAKHVDMIYSNGVSSTSGNGTITTIDANTNSKTNTFYVRNWAIIGTWTDGANNPWFGLGPR